MTEVDQIRQELARLEAARQFSQALAVAQQALKAHPRERALAIAVGQLLLACKQPRQALALFKALHDEGQSQTPPRSELPVLLGLARCLLDAGQHAEAGKLYQQLVQKLPKHPDALSGLAACRRKAAQPKEAQALAQRALKAAPQHTQGRYELAEALVAQGLKAEALPLLELNIRRADLHGDSLDLWMQVLRELERHRYAQDVLEALAQQFPQVLEFVYGFAVLANKAGEVSLARPAFDRAIALSPDNARLYYEAGVMERTAGQLERAQSLIARSLELKPDSPAALRTFGAETKYQYGDDNFKRLNYVAARFTEFSALEQIHLHYAQAKAYEDVDELDTAFRHYEIAGAKKRKTQPYNEKEASRLFQVVPKVVTRKNLAAAQQRGCESEVPVFILGMPRSGTSLMEQILSSHPDIFGAGELKFLTGILENIGIGPEMGARLRMGDKDPVFDYDLNASWEARGQRFVEKLEKLAGQPYARIVDKMPGNFNFVGLIHAILPNAKIIHSRRHPVETCLSCYRIHFAEGHQWSYNLRQLGRFYKRYWNMMAYWRQEFPGVMHEVRYEDNVADVEGQARQLINHLGLPWNDRCLEFYNTDRPVKTASVTQVRKPIYTTSTNRWRRYERYLGPLLEELGDIVPQYEAEIAHLSPKA